MRDSRENKAYRQFRSILQNFFLQVAADFFRTDGVHAETFDIRKNELSREDEIRKRRERHVSERRRKFQTSLNAFFDRLAANKPHEEATALTEEIAKDLQSAC